MIQIDPEDGSVRIEFPRGETITVEGLPSEALTERGTQQALFLEQDEAATLAKMIDYILDKVRITPESKAALQAVRPRLDQLFQE